MNYYHSWQFSKYQQSQLLNECLFEELTTTLVQPLAAENAKQESQAQLHIYRDEKTVLKRQI